MDPELPILWLYGPPGAGKSVTAWDLFQRNSTDQVGYVDIDQLRMLFPPPTDPTARDAQAATLGARGLAAVARAHRRHGSRTLIVSGVIDEAEVGHYRQELRGIAEIRWVLLEVDESSLRERISARGWPEDLADRVVEDSRRLSESTFADRRIRTAGQSVGAVTDRIQGLLRMRTPGIDHAPDQHSSLAGPLSVLCVFGPRAVGTSTTAWALMLRRTKVGRRVGFLDAQQVGFVHGPGETRDAITHDVLAALASEFMAAGAEGTIVNGSMSVPLLRRLADERARLVRLQAPLDVIAQHVADRLDGSAARLAGDDLVGASNAAQLGVLRLSERQTREYAAARLPAVVLDVGSRTAKETADLIEW